MPDAQWRDAKHFIAGDRGVTQWIFTATRKDGSKIEAARDGIVFSFRDGRMAVKDTLSKASDVVVRFRRLPISLHRPRDQGCNRA